MQETHPGSGPGEGNNTVAPNPSTSPCGGSAGGTPQQKVPSAATALASSSAAEHSGPEPIGSTHHQMESSPGTAPDSTTSTAPQQLLHHHNHRQNNSNLQHANAKNSVSPNPTRAPASSHNHNSPPGDASTPNDSRHASAQNLLQQPVNNTQATPSSQGRLQHNHPEQTHHNSSVKHKSLSSLYNSLTMQLNHLKAMRSNPDAKRYNPLKHLTQDSSLYHSLFTNHPEHHDAHQLHSTQDSSQLHQPPRHNTEADALFLLSHWNGAAHVRSHLDHLKTSQTTTSAASSSTTTFESSPQNSSQNASLPSREYDTVSARESEFIRQEGELKQKCLQILGLGMHNVNFTDVLYASCNKSSSESAHITFSQDSQKDHSESPLSSTRPSFSYHEPKRNKTDWDYLLDEVQWMSQQQQHSRKRKRLENRQLALQTSSQFKKLLLTQRDKSQEDPNWALLVRMLKDLHIPSGVLSATAWDSNHENNDEHEFVLPTIDHSRSLNIFEQEQLEFFQHLHAQRHSALVYEDPVRCSSRVAATRFIHSHEKKRHDTSVSSAHPPMGRSTHHLIVVSTRESLCEWKMLLEQSDIQHLIWLPDDVEQWKQQFILLEQCRDDYPVCIIPFGLLLQEMNSHHFSCHNWSTVIFDDAHLYHSHLLSPMYESLQYIHATSKILLDHSMNSSVNDTNRDSKSLGVCKSMAYLLTVLPHSASFYQNIRAWLDDQSPFIGPREPLIHQQSSDTSAYSVEDISTLQKLLQQCLSAFQFQSKYQRMDTPRFSEEKHLCHLSGRQLLLYQKFVSAAQVVDPSQWSKDLTLAYLNNLQKICNHPDLVENDLLQDKAINSTVVDGAPEQLPSTDDVHDCGKISVLWPLLNRYQREQVRSVDGTSSGRVLIVTHMPAMIPFLEDLLDQLFISYKSLYGNESLSEYMHVCDSFNNSEDTFCFISYVSNSSLCLRGVKHVVIWDYAPQIEGIKDSLTLLHHRLSHYNPQLIFHYLMCRGTFEESLVASSALSDSGFSIADYLNGNPTLNIGALSKVFNLSSPHQGIRPETMDTDHPDYDSFQSYSSPPSLYDFVNHVKLLDDDIEYQVYEITPETTRAFEATILAPELFPDSLFEDHLHLKKPAVLEEIDNQKYEIPSLDQKPVIKLKDRGQKRKRAHEEASVSETPKSQKMTVKLKKRKVSQTEKAATSQQQQMTTPTRTPKTPSQKFPKISKKKRKAEQEKLKSTSITTQSSPAASITTTKSRHRKKSSKSSRRESSWSSQEDDTLRSSVWVASDAQKMLGDAFDQILVSLNWDFVAYTLNGVFGQTATPRSAVSCRERYRELCSNFQTPSTLLSINKKASTTKLQQLIRAHDRKVVTYPELNTVVKRSSKADARSFAPIAPLQHVVDLAEAIPPREQEYKSLFTGGRTRQKSSQSSTKSSQPQQNSSASTPQVQRDPSSKQEKKKKKGKQESKESQQHQFQQSTLQQHRNASPSSSQVSSLASHNAPAPQNRSPHQQQQRPFNNPMQQQFQQNQSTQRRFSQ